MQDELPPQDYIRLTDAYEIQIGKLRVALGARAAKPILDQLEAAYARLRKGYPWKGKDAIPVSNPDRQGERRFYVSPILSFTFRPNILLDENGYARHVWEILALTLRR
jgi:hypothetical protein